MKNRFKQFIRHTVDELVEMSNTDERFSTKSNPTTFEKLVVEASENVLNNLNIKYSLRYDEGSHAFPDIVYSFEDNIKLGIEVKSSTSANSSSNSWTILGNSILGSTSIEVDDTYIIFIKINKHGCFINYARYEDVVSDIVVTHSPRYKINLSQDPEKSFFKKSGISYKEIKTSDNPIKIVTDYFKEQGETAWWIAESTPAVIKTWDEINNEDRSLILAKAFVLFPELLYSTGSLKYKRLAKWLVANYSVVDTSLRDRFTAGGRTTIVVDNCSFSNMPRVFDTFWNLFPTFLEQIEEISLEQLQDSWESYYPSSDNFIDRLEYWKSRVLDKFNSDENFIDKTKFIETLFTKINLP